LISKKYFIIICIILTSTSYVYGQYGFNTLRAQYVEGELSYQQYLVYSALNIFDPKQVPQNYQLDSTTLPIKSGTFIINEIKRNWDLLDSNSQKLLAKYFSRPELQHSLLSASRRFRIHYDTDGPHKVLEGDYNKNGIPDFVESAAELFDHSHQMIVEDLGYQPPAPDSSGTGKEFNIYLVALSRTYGITWLEELVPGKTNAYSCYIEVDNDFAGFDTKPLPSLKVTSAHEYFHAVQVCYCYRDEDVFFMEMCSTWMEDFVYPEVNDYFQYLDNYFRNINYPFYYTNCSWFEYASCLWNHMITNKYDPEVIKKIWEAIPQQTAFTSIHQVLLEFGTTFNDELTAFGLWNYFTKHRADTMNYYSEGHLYPSVSFEGTYTVHKSQLNLKERMRKLSSIFYQVIDSENDDEVGLIITNFAEPDNNYMPTDRDSFQINIVSPTEIQKKDSTFFRKNNLVRITDNLGVNLIVKDDKNWFANAVVIDANQNTEIVQFFPPFSVADEEKGNFINNMYPNPLILGQNEPLLISFVVSEQKAGEVAIYTSNGRLVTSFAFEVSLQNYRIMGWDGRNSNGELVSSGIYIVLLRVGGFVDMKKLAVVRK